MKKSIRNLELENKKVIIRVDFNVPMNQGEIIDDKRIQESLQTIEYAIKKKAKVILLSHLGRVKTEQDKKHTLKPIAVRLEQLLNQKVTFINQTRGLEVEQAIQNMQKGEVVLLENTRFEDINGKKESNNDPELGAYWASLADIFINDAFGTCHRSHASNVGIASHLPNAIGFLIEKELTELKQAIDNPKRPYTVILGGAKVEDKIGVIKNLVEIADYILIAGGMSFTFLKSQNIEIGKSLLDENSIEFCKEILAKYPNKIILPIDTITAKQIDIEATTQERFIQDIEKEEIGLDIGPKTISLFKQYLMDSKTIIWNGPVGYFELEPFANGTKQLCSILATLNATTIIGGGDTASAAIQFGFQNQFTHISTGGGASLQLLEGKKLPGIECIHEN